MSDHADDRSALVAQLRLGGPGDTVRDALRRALDDPTLDLVYPRVGSGGWIDALGEPTAVPAQDDERAFTPITRDGNPCAGLLHDPALLAAPDRLRAATEAASLALDNERLKAALRAELLEVQASRARIVDAGDRQLQRVERDLHDGAQQRLVGLALALRLAGRSAAGDAAVTALLDDAARELDDALVELRKLTRGIHPAIVDDAGLGGALETLAERPGVPVDLYVELVDPLPQPVEVGAYYVVAETLTNANKHANATLATVRATVVDAALLVTVSDDGAGGAAPTPGSGLEGLADRVSALGGELAVDSPVGGGTTVVARLPLTNAVVSDVERRRLAALEWIGWENWQAPGELYEQITDEDNLTDVKAALLGAGGRAHVTDREFEWLIGYHTAADTAEWVLEAAAAFDDRETLDDLVHTPGFDNIARGGLYTALRMCACDGPLTPGELDRITHAADVWGISRDTLAELQQIVAAEQALRARRYELIVAPVLPGYVDPCRP